MRITGASGRPHWEEHGGVCPCEEEIGGTACAGVGLQRPLLLELVVDVGGAAALRAKSTPGGEKSGIGQRLPSNMRGYKNNQTAELPGTQRLQLCQGPAILPPGGAKRKG